ncbi:MAG: hypothetical protein COT73_04540 [Bdellovibrio sp. CG10_big_fil_rev_8_21_14_0_10_47_8]|nr:MAG: hypothetical protein COT73_04540 [Bdellovibrio sp. CG10_big_fil_rev_8_21_14_0_10_47_8]
MYGINLRQLVASTICSVAIVSVYHEINLRYFSPGRGLYFFNGTRSLRGGPEALQSPSDGVSNVALGFETLASNSDGESNIALGDRSLFYNLTGNSNIGIGAVALFANTTGHYNVAIGSDTLRSNTTGDHNIAINYDALHNSTTGSDNSAIGYLAMFNNTEGQGNVALGAYAGRDNVHGSYNTWVGLDSGPETMDSFSNSVALGFDARTTKSNQVVIGNKKIEETILRGKVSIGEGTPISRIHSVRQTLDFPPTSGKNISDLRVHVQGARPGDAVSLGVPLESVSDTGTYSAWVSSSDTVTIRYKPRLLEDPAPGPFRVLVVGF